MFIRRPAASLSRLTRLFSSNNSTADLAGAIAELNQEMESVFGEIPPSGIAGSVGNDYKFKEPEPQITSHSVFGGLMGEQGGELTHVGSSGEAQMVDVSAKEDSRRTAIASCKVVLGKKVFDMVLANQLAKGDVLTVAKIAAINGAKHTSNLIPLCHNINISHVRVDLVLNPADYSVRIEGEAVTTAKTGVEMEAMTAVTVAGLTVYDMCKAASKEIQITDVQLEKKTGGKSGNWFREN